MKNLPQALALTVALAGAAGPALAQPTVRLYKSVGSVQCSGGGTSLQAMKQALGAAGVSPISATCGVDGNLYPAMCGAPDGRIAIIEVASSVAAGAGLLGFRPLSELPDATPRACTAGSGDS